MFSGFVIMFISTLSKTREEKKRGSSFCLNSLFCLLAFAFSKSFGLLFVARAIQGVGSACSSVSGK